MAARLVTGARKYDLIPLVLHVLAASGVFEGATVRDMPLLAKKSVSSNKRKNRKT